MTKSEATFLLHKIIRRFGERNLQIPDIYIAGSQSILGLHEQPSQSLAFSREIDVLIDDMDKNISNEVNISMGQFSNLSEDFKLEVDLISHDTLSCSSKWIDRCTVEAYSTEEGYKAKVHFMDPHDLLFCKLIAGREKDLIYVEEMFRCHLLSPNKIKSISREISKDVYGEDVNRVLFFQRLNHFCNKHYSPSAVFTDPYSPNIKNNIERFRENIIDSRILDKNDLEP